MKTHERIEFIKQKLADASNIDELREAWMDVQEHMTIIKNERIGSYKFLIAHKDWLKKEIGKNYAK